MPTASYLYRIMMAYFFTNINKQSFWKEDDEQWVTGGVDDKDDSYDGKFNPNVNLFQLQLHSNFYYSPTFSYQQRCW